MREGEREKGWAVEMEIGTALFGATAQEHERERDSKTVRRVW